MIAIAHADCDGVACISLLYQAKNTFKIPTFFTTPKNLRNTLCRSMINRELDELYIFDLSGDKKTCRIASAFSKVVWIDHHVWEEKEEYDNINFILEESPSACELASQYFGIKSELASLINEIDRNEVEREDAKFLRDVCGAIKYKFSKTPFLNKKLVELAKTLAFGGLEKLRENPSITNLLLEYRKWIEGLEGKIIAETIVREKNGYRIAFYQTTQAIPTYLVFNKLREHESAPFDLIVIFYYSSFSGRLRTKLEFRTQTGKDVLKIAKELGGGGHRIAAGASLERLFTPAELERLIEDKF